MEVVAYADVLPKPSRKMAAHQDLGENLDDLDVEQLQPMSRMKTRILRHPFQSLQPRGPREEEGEVEEGVEEEVAPRIDLSHLVV